MNAPFLSGFADEMVKVAKLPLSLKVKNAIERSQQRSASARSQATRGAGLKGTMQIKQAAMPGLEASPANQALGQNPLIGGLAGYMAQGDPDQTPKSGFWRGMLGGMAGGAGGIALSRALPSKYRSMGAIGAGTVGQLLGGYLGGRSAELDPEEREEYMARKIKAYLDARKARDAIDDLAEEATEKLSSYADPEEVDAATEDAFDWNPNQNMTFGADDPDYGHGKGLAEKKKKMLEGKRGNQIRHLQQEALRQQAKRRGMTVGD